MVFSKEFNEKLFQIDQFENLEFAKSKLFNMNHIGIKFNNFNLNLSKQKYFTIKTFQMEQFIYTHVPRMCRLQA